MDKKAILKTALFAAVALAPAIASASSSSGAEFDEIWNTLLGWTQGQLGKIIAVSMILVGLIGGIARQSLMAFAIGVAGGMGLYNAPDIIDLIFSASIPVGSVVAPLVPLVPVI